MAVATHVANFSYSKNLSHLKAHYSYVSRKSVLVYAYNADSERKKELFSFAKQRKARRKDARVALKGYIALPYDWWQLAQKDPLFLARRAEDLASFLAGVFNLKKEDVMLFFHKPSKEDSRNFHVHVLVPYRHADGRTLRLGTKDLHTFHKEWDNFLLSMGYEIHRLRNYLPNLTPKEVHRMNLPWFSWNDPQNEKAQKYRKLQQTARDLKKLQDAQLERFFNTLYDPEDVLWVVVRNPQTGQAKRISIRAGEFRKYIGLLRYYNANLFDVYITVNSYKPDAPDRSGEHILPMQDKIWLDVDAEKVGMDGEEFLKKLLAETGLPMPTLTVKTSQNNYQVYWRLKEKVPFERLQELMQILEERYGLDHTHDRARVLRLPGFNNQKRGGGLCLIWQELSDHKRYSFSEFLSKVVKPAPSRALPTQAEDNGERTTKPQKQVSQTEEAKLLYRKALEAFARKHGIEIDLSNVKLTEKSFSELDYAFAKALLKKGTSKGKVEELLKSFLTQHRPEKLQRSPDYAKLTTDKAYEDVLFQAKQGYARILSEKAREVFGVNVDFSDFDWQKGKIKDLEKFWMKALLKANCRSLDLIDVLEQVVRELFPHEKDPSQRVFNVWEEAFKELEQEDTTLSAREEEQETKEQKPRPPLRR